MKKKFLPLIIFPILIITSCGETITPVATNKILTEITTTMGAEEEKVFAEINQTRSVGRYCGSSYYPAAGELKWNSSLSVAASGHSLDMAKNHFFAHTSPSGSTAYSRIEAAGYKGWTTAGENLAAGSRPNEVVQVWLSSTGHCANIMNPKFTEMGISYLYSQGSDFGTYWVTDFGSR